MSEIDKAYRILGLEMGASAQEVEEAYRDLRAVWHPDRFVNDPKLQEKASGKIAELEGAFSTLQELRPGEAPPRKSREEPDSRSGQVGNRPVSAANPPERLDSAGPHGANDRMPSLFDDAFAERIKKPRRLVLVWPVLFVLVALGSVISYLRWSPVEVEPAGESGLSERLAEGLRKRDEVNSTQTGTVDPSSITRETPQSGIPEESEPGARPQEPPVPAERAESRQLQSKVVPSGRTQTQSTQESASRPQAGRSKETNPATQDIPARAPSAEKMVDSGQRTSSQPVDPETPSEIQSTDEGAVRSAGSDAAKTELAGRAFQILRAKSDMANRLVEGSFPELSYLGWKPIEESSDKVFLDLTAERTSDAVKLHLVWSVDMESNSVKALSQAARDLEAGGLQLK
jgi:hypothetical protein